MEKGGAERVRLRGNRQRGIGKTGIHIVYIYMKWNRENKTGQPKPGEAYCCSAVCDWVFCLSRWS